MEKKQKFRWWAWFYTKEELTTTLQSFDEDTDLVKGLRYFFLATNLILFTLFLEFEPIGKLMLFFTMWTSLFTIEYFFVAAMIQYVDKAPVQLRAIHHILFQVTLVMNVIVVLFYWSLLYRLDMAKPEMVKNPYKQWLHVFIHSWPLLSVGVNFFVSQVTMKRNQGYFLIPISLAYSVVYYFGTKKLGRPLYPFLDWKNPYIYLILLGIFVFAQAVHNVLTKVTHWLRGNKITEKPKNA